MATIRSNQHFWTYLPELGSGWSYCDRCDQCQRADGEGGFYTYAQALAMVQREKEEAMRTVYRVRYEGAVDPEWVYFLECLPMTGLERYQIACDILATHPEISEVSWVTPAEPQQDFNRVNRSENYQPSPGRNAHLLVRRIS